MSEQDAFVIRSSGLGESATYDLRYQGPGGTATVTRSYVPRSAAERQALERALSNQSSVRISIDGGSIALVLD